MLCPLLLGTLHLRRKSNGHTTHQAGRKVVVHQLALLALRWTKFLHKEELHGVGKGRDESAAAPQSTLLSDEQQYLRVKKVGEDQHA